MRLALPIYSIYREFLVCVHVNICTYSIYTHSLMEKHGALMIERAMLAFFRDGL